MRDSNGNDVLVTEATLPAVLRLLAERSSGSGVLFQFSPSGCVNQCAWLGAAGLNFLTQGASLT